MNGEPSPTPNDKSRQHPASPGPAECPLTTAGMSGDLSVPATPPDEVQGPATPAGGPATVAYTGDAEPAGTGEPAEAEDTRPAARKLGEFCIVREIGRGGMGTVYEAVQETLGRKVALKVLRGAAMMDEKAIHRFYREAEAIGRLHHPNIIPVYSVGDQDGTHYYSMELVQGISLAQIIRAMRDGALDGSDPFDPASYALAPEYGSSTASQATVETPRTVSKRLLTTRAPESAGTETRRVLSVNRRFINSAVEMIAQIAEALHHAHSQGIIHRDLKPANLLLAERGKLVLTDFGLARQEGSHTLTQAGDFMGTPLYMSPEQALAGRGTVDHRTDIYSLGVTLYELLTLQAPYEGATTHAVLREVVTKEPVSFRRLHVRLPRDLEVITFKALEKDPDRRYQSAKEMADDLRRFLNYQAIHAKPPGTLTRCARLARRHRTSFVVAATAMLAAVLLALAVNGYWQRRHSQKVAKFLEEGSALLDRGSAAQLDDLATGYFDEAKERFASALVLDEANVAATQGLLDIYFRRCERALERGEFEMARGILIPLKELDRQGLHARKIAGLERQAVGTGAWSVQTQPAGCRVMLARLDDAFALEAPQDMGTSSMSPRPIEMGNYLVVLTHANYPEVRYPMRIDRNDEEVVNVLLLARKQIPEGMVYVPAGEFLFGDPRDGMAQVHLEGFLIDRTEVTGAQYEAFVQATGAAAPESWGESKSCPPPLRDAPVFNVSWFEAAEYAHWAGKRLPTEQEWEKAARGVDGRRYPWGDRWARRRANDREASTSRTQVGQFPLGASPYGCLDMAGNVWEWTTSREKPLVTSMIMRGGAGYSTPHELASYDRQGAPPAGSSFGALNLTGFRCVKSLDATPAKPMLDQLETSDDFSEAAQLYWPQQRFDMVRQCAERMLKLNPRSIPGHYWRSAFLEQEQKFAEALAELGIVYLQDPNYRRTRQSVAKLIETLDKAGQEVDKRFLDAPKLFAEAQAALRAGEYAKAEEPLKQILEWDADNALAHKMLAAVCAATDRPAEAAEHNERRAHAYRAALAEDRGNDRLLNEFAWFLAERGMHREEGIKLIRRALKVEPDNAAYLDTLAELLHQTGRTVEALKHIRQAIELDPEEEHYRKQLDLFEQALAKADQPPTKDRKQQSH